MFWKAEYLHTVTENNIQHLKAEDSDLLFNGPNDLSTTLRKLFRFPSYLSYLMTEFCTRTQNHGVDPAYPPLTADQPLD
jgi:hypothetical protein